MNLSHRSQLTLIAWTTLVSAILLTVINPSHADQSGRPSKLEIQVGDYHCDTQTVTVYSVSQHNRKKGKSIESVKVYLADGTSKKYSSKRRSYEFTVHQNDYPAAVNSVRLKVHRKRGATQYAEIDFKSHCSTNNGGGSGDDGGEIASGCTIAGTHVDTVASQQECDALIATYVGSGGGSPEGNAWSRDLWNTPTDPCLWEGISCDTNGVTGLDLSHAFFIPGEIPIELYNLVNLTSLNLASSEIVGVVAPEIEQLTELKELVLLGNYFPTLPPEIGNLKKLEILDIQSLENWSGGLPDEWAGLDSLTELYINSIFLYDQDATPFFAGVIDTLEYLSAGGYDQCVKVTDPELDAALLLLPAYPGSSYTGAWADASVDCR